ncbi:transcriptional regulator [Paenibacillus taichungensis]|uniref:transcriptional regulator n=1 Tax=Paenibacillus taichungensis TaxID=484184 RepID=UPI0038211B66
MEPTTTIRSFIEDYIRKQGYTLQYFADISGVNAGTLSAIIKGTRPIAMAQLDLITQGMKLEEGHFYEIYGAECFVESAPHWRRLEPFLQRCAELDKLECIQRIIQQVTDDRSYISELFEMAEGMLERGQKKAARMLYECVAECEKYQHSERLALCQYRIFTLSLGQDQHENLRAAVHFEPYINRLDEERQLDAIKDLANTYLALRYWDKVSDLGGELEQKTSFLNSYKKRKSENLRIASYPIFVYSAYSNLLRAAACDGREEYSEALRYTEAYSKLIRIEQPNEEDLIFINKFSGWAEVNHYLYRLMMGDSEVIRPYIAFIEKNEAEILPALVKIMEAANHHNIDVDAVLNRLESYISMYAKTYGDIGSYTEQITSGRYVQFLKEVAIYQLQRERYTTGFQYLLDCLALAKSMKSESIIIQCVALFERHRARASIELEIKYKTLIEEVYSNYEKKSSFDRSFV